MNPLKTSYLPRPKGGTGPVSNRVTYESQRTRVVLSYSNPEEGVLVSKEGRGDGLGLTGRRGLLRSTVGRSLVVIPHSAREPKTWRGKQQSSNSDRPKRLRSECDTTQSCYRVVCSICSGKGPSPSVSRLRKNLRTTHHFILLSVFGPFTQT